jgi:hypothetical protein
MAERAQQKPESRRRFALALAGMDDEKAFFNYRLGGDLGVLRGLALCHFLLVAKGLGIVLSFGHRAFLATGHRSKNRRKPRLGGAFAEALGEASQDNFAIKGAIVNLAASLARYIRMDGDSGSVSV